MGFAENLYRLRKAKGLTQQKLADALHMKRSNIGMYEQGRQLPSISKLQTFADYFHVDMNELISGGGGGPALTPEEQHHLHQYRLLDTDNQQAIDKQINYLLYEQEEEYKKDGATSAS